MPDLMQEIARRTLILDGAMGTELERRGVPMDDTAWSAAAILKYKHDIAEIHRDYVVAGAEVITTNTFATTRYILESIGLGSQVPQINRDAVEAAKTARSAAKPGQNVWIAGSISPMAPGSDAARRPDVATAEKSFRELAGELKAAGVDCILLEMVRDIPYAVVMLKAARSTGLPVWAGLSCSEVDGEIVVRAGVGPQVPLEEILPTILAHRVDLVAIMHTDVEITEQALRVVRRHWDGLLGAYPHSGHFKMPHWDFNSVMSPDAYATEVLPWVDKYNLNLIGGCCGIGPQHIAELRARLR